LKPSFAPQTITPDFLNSLRSQTDPLGDQVIASIISSGKEKQINDILMNLVRNDSFQKGMFASLGPETSAVMDSYIEESSQLPAWADTTLIKKGQKLFELYGPEVFMLLNVSSLPMCYCCGKGAQVLFDTGRLMAPNGNTDPLARRLMETAQMIVNVLSPGGLDANGRGIVTLQKVRLIHASIRYFLKHQQTPWDGAKLGEPINQEDLAGTLMSFGPVILAGLKKLGVRFSDEDATAYMHCWNIAGHMLGIGEALLPDTYEQGFELASKILSHQAQPSEAGKALTSSCTTFINYVIPGNAFDSLPSYLMWYFLQDFSESSEKDLASCIGVSSQADMKDKLVVRLTHFVTETLSVVESHDVFVRKVVSAFNKLLLQGIIHYYNGGKGVQFFIPPSLEASWGLSNQWRDTLSSPAFLGHRISWQTKIENIKNQS
jgi:hypothetical protein